MIGQCLCGAVKFELGGRVPDLYQCHCSLCRKTSGSSANAALRIETRRFNWREGEAQISRYSTASGYKSHFCRRCGSPLPNPSADDEYYWVPAGLLEDDAGIELAAHLFVGSRAAWDRIADAGRHYDEMPDGDTLQRLLERRRAPADD